MGEFRAGLEDAPLPAATTPTAFCGAVVTAGQVTTSACAAYAFARLEWRGRDTLFLCYLATMDGARRS